LESQKLLLLHQILLAQILLIQSFELNGKPNDERICRWMTNDFLAPLAGAPPLSKKSLHTLRANFARTLSWLACTQ
jgi:hypothetical protein